MENYEIIIIRFENIIKPMIEKYDKIYTKTKIVIVIEVPLDNNQAQRDLRII